MAMAQELVKENAIYASQQSYESGRSPLMEASHCGHVQALLKFGAPWNAVDRKGQSAGNDAMDKDHWEIVNLPGSTRTITLSISISDHNSDSKYRRGFLCWLVLVLLLSIFVMEEDKAASQGEDEAWLIIFSLLIFSFFFFFVC